MGTALVAVLAAVLVALPALLGAPAGGAQAAPARPTADPLAPTPTAPPPGGPPQGSGPGGVTVGGEELDTRGTVVAEGTPPLPEGVVAPGWLVADADGTVLAARDPHGRYAPASTLKTLTLLTLLPLLDPEHVVEGTVEDEAVEGSRVGLVAGGRYPVRLLFEALVMQSGNDAALALARAAGGVDVTLRAMNETARALGAYDTVAGSPSGLDVAGQSSSPYDLVLVFRRLLADPRAAALLVTPTAQMPPVEGRSEGYQIQNENPLLSRYPGNLGGKTGFTDAARHTFVTAAERDGRRLLVSVMGTENVPLRAADQAALLLDWGFAVPAGTPGVGVLVDSAADVPPPSRTAPRTTGPPPAVAAAGASAAPAGPPPSALLPAVLALTAVAVAALAVTGRRRARRWVPRSGRAAAEPARPAPRGSPGPPPGGSRSRPR
ncbi:D-alanyl-D-alanine carboxypeptidase [Geodermatophilus marinus]|nr:D-alanyl-D-alanine carboxypeptidase [Geodermatophilus sp. LHW52908]